MRIHRTTAGAALALFLAGCGGGEREAAAAIPRARFVAANVALRTVPDTAANAAAMRLDSLKKYRVSEKELKAFVAAHARDAEYMAEVWREISEKVEKAHERTFASQQPVEGAEPGPPPPNGEPVQIVPPDGPPPPPVSVMPGVQPGAPMTIPPEAVPAPTPVQPPREMVRPGPPPSPERPVRDSALRTPPAGPPPDARRPWQPPASDTLMRPTPRPPRGNK